MPVYTVHQRPGDPAGPELLREGFAGWAALLPPLWFLRYGLWPALAVYCLVAAALVALLAPGDPLLPAGFVLLHFVCGLAGRDLRRWQLGRRGSPTIAVIEASGDDAAFARIAGAPDYAGWRAAARPLPGTGWSPWTPGGDGT